MSERGSGLLDAIAATAIGLLVAQTATDTVGAIRALALSEDRDRLLVTARNVLEQAIGAPCGPAPVCPQEATCTIATEAMTSGPPPLSLVRVSVEAAAGGVAPVQLSSVRAEACT
jgi:hypothetical protein